MLSGVGLRYYRGVLIIPFFQEKKIMNDLPAGKGRDASHKYFSIAIAIQQYFGEADCLLSLFPLGCQSLSYTSSYFIALSR